MTEDGLHCGGCLCGKIRYQAKGKPSSVSICHCRSCQRAAGGDSVAWAEFPVGAVSWSGVAWSVYKSSPGVERTFCPECGSSLSYQIEAGYIDLVVACFDEPESFSPEKELWLDHRLSYNVRHPDIPGYRQFRSDGLIAE